MANDVWALDVSIRKDYVEIEDGSNARTSVLTLKRSDYGLWQQVWDFGLPQADLLLAALGSRQDLGRWGLVFRQPDTKQIVASGPLATLIPAEGRRNGVAADAVSAWGVTDLTHLRERTIYPVPSVDIPVTTSTVHTWSSFTRNKTGAAETVALAYINENIGPGALERRRLGTAAQKAAGGVLDIPASLGRGPTVTYKARANENVLEVAVRLLDLAGLSIDVLQTEAGRLQLVLHEAQLREGILWSVEAGTARGVSVKAQRRPKTSVINSGSGDDATTVYVRRDADPPPGGGGYSEVREEFIKGSGDAEDIGDLIFDAEEELVEDGPELGLDVEPEPAAPWRVGIDYELGDPVIGRIFGIDYEIPLQQVVLRHEDGTLVEEPSAGYADEESLDPVLRMIFRRLGRLTKRST